MSIHESIIAEEQTPDDYRRPSVRMTEDEFVAWCDDDVKAEWVDGEVIVMAPTSFDHGDFNGWLLTVFREFVEHHDLGRVNGSEVAVRLVNLRRRRIPDLMFVARQRASIISKNHVEGAPDLIVEIVSPDSESRDWREKYLDYEAAGVREYWVIDRNTAVIEVYSLNSANAYERLREVDGKIHSTVLPGFYLRPNWLWQNPLPKVAAIRKELGVIY